MSTQFWLFSIGYMKWLGDEGHSILEHVKAVYYIIIVL